jgi:hypothetical protein
MFVDIIFHKKRFRIPERITGSDGKLYTIQEQIAEGGNAVVCECADESDGRTPVETAGPRDSRSNGN